MRINAAARANGLSYSKVIATLKKSNIGVNRKMLAEMAVNKPDDFIKLVTVNSQQSIVNSQEC